MTPSLSVLLTNVIQGNAANSQSAPSTINALSQATRLATIANVTIARLPEQILQIQTNGAPKAQIKLPAALALPSTTKLQLAALSSSAIAEPEKPDLGVVISQNTGSKTTPVSQQQLAQVTTELTKLLANQPNAKAQVHGVIHQLDSRGIQVNLSSGSTIDISVSRQQAPAAASLQPGQAVTLTINSDKNGALNLAISPKLQHNQGAPLPSPLPALTSTLAVADSKAQALVSSALKQGGIAFVHENGGAASALEKYLPPIKTATTLQQASLFALKGNTITTTSVAAQAVTKFTLPAPLQEAIVSAPKDRAPAPAPTVNRQVVLSPAVPAATLVSMPQPNNQGGQLSTTKVPASAQVPTSTTTPQTPVTKGDSVTPKRMPNANVQASSAQQFNGTQVHQAIITLSRTLLSQTGSTQQALSQLLTIVNGRQPSDAAKAVVSPPSVAARSALPPQTQLSAETRQFLTKIGQALTPLNEKAPQIVEPVARRHDKRTPPLNASADSRNELKGDSAASQRGHLANTSDPAQSASYVKRTWSQLANILLPSNSTVTNSGEKTTSTKVNASQIEAAVNKHALQSELGSLVEDSEKGKSTVKDSATPGQTVNVTTAVNNPQTLSTRIQSLLTTPALAVTPLNLTSPVAASNFVQGLVALLQVSLAGRAMQRQPSIASLIDKPDSAVSKTLATSGVTSGSSSRVAQDMATLDSRSNLLANLKTLLANHQQSKVSQAESRVQGQDSFYYVLPSLSQHSAAPELLIQRENDRHQQKEGDTAKHRQWNITMKLEIGEVGEVLAKSKIQGEMITLDLYASTSPLLSRIADTLPYLKQRLSNLGLVVESASFQRGNIPSTLNSRPHQIFETRV